MLLKLSLIIVLCSWRELYASSDGTLKQKDSSHIVAIVNPADVAFANTPPKKEEQFMRLFSGDDTGIIQDLKNRTTVYLDKFDHYPSSTPSRKEVQQQKNDLKELRNHMGKQMLKYVDKRITGEIRNAKKGSPLYKARQVENAIRPHAIVQINPKIRLRVRGRPLEGKVVLQLANPVVETEAQIRINGHVEINFERDLGLGVKSKVTMDITKNEYVASLRKEIAGNFVAEASSKQNLKTSIFNSQSEKKIELKVLLGF